MVIPWTKVWAVVITGLVVVFLALVLLIVFVQIFGKIFSGIANKEKKGSKPDVIPVPQVTVPENVTRSVPEPEISGDNDEVIAVISAAVAMMAARDGKKYAVRSINRTENRRRSAGSVWGAAGQRENTLPF
ncbi:MAG: OadG family protein [Oscillospiraceae bacterium]|nr:OadG family protein [Oscillospiraceae bacterium]